MKTYNDDLLNKQCVSKRRYAGWKAAGKPEASRLGLFRVKPSGSGTRGGKSGRTVSRKPAYRPAGVSSLFEQNVRFIDKMQQKPSRNHRGGNGFFSNFSSLREMFEEREDTGFERQPCERNSREPKLPLLSIPGVPFAALFILAIGVFFVVYSQASQAGAFDWLNREVVSSEKDPGSQYNLALYAGVNAPERAAEAGEAIPLDLTETFTWQAYRVKRGDSVSKIASAYSVSMDAIIASNGIANARALREGEELKIPNMDGIPYTVKNGDSLLEISRGMGVPMEAILDANDLQSEIINAGKVLFIPGARMKREDLKMALGELFIYPLGGARLTSPFGWRNDPISGVRRHHAAVDLSAPQGTPIRAAMDGKVSSTGYNGTYGNFIIITHTGGYQSMYAHLHTISVKKGVEVSQGSRIGTVGNTGYSTGPHLHFAIFKNNRAVNPLDFLHSKS